jgi:glucokinase
VADDTPLEMQQADLQEAQREVGEANAKWMLASGLDAAADVMETLGFDEAATDAEAAATAARASGVVDALQAMSWMTAASSWGEVANDLDQQSDARGGAYVAGARALGAEDDLAEGGLTEAEQTKARVEAARSRAEETELNERAEELAGSAREAAEAAAMAERAARNLDD